MTFDRALADALGLTLRGATTFRLGESFDAIRQALPHRDIEPASMTSSP